MFLNRTRDSARHPTLMDGLINQIRRLSNFGLGPLSKTDVSSYYQEKNTTLVVLNNVLSIKVTHSFVFSVKRGKVLVLHTELVQA